ncbi:MAG: penicillin-binding protein 2 [Rhodocyclaceae bacterium]
MRPTEFRNPKKEVKGFRIRLGVAAVVVVIAMGVLLARFFYLQILRHDYYQTRAEENRISLVPIVPSRGVIKDRHGEVLASNYSAYTLEIAPGKVDNLDATIAALGELVEIQPKDIKRFRRLADEASSLESVPIRTRLTDEEVARFTANRYRFPGVDVNGRLFRQYPLGEVASHVVGYIGRINQKEKEALEDSDDGPNYRGTDHIGKTGLEKRYEAELHGISGYEQVEVDAGGHAVRTLSRTPPVAGNDLLLSLDLKLQRIAEKAFGSRRGALVAIEPGSGDVLAYVSSPSFDPNLFIDGIDPQSWDGLNNSPDHPMINRPINGTYPPGSTFKPFMALAGLTLGKRTPHQVIHDPGFFNFGGHTFRDDKKGGHGSVDAYKSIVVSCDTYYYMLANDLGIDNISRFMGEFGFGQKTGIDLPGESEGVLPSQEWKRKRFKKPEQQKWYAGETISIGIGQGYNSYTPLQLAHAMATLANNGVAYKPHMVKYIENMKTGEKVSIAPHPLKTLPLKKDHMDLVKRAMVGVNRDGTGARAFAGASYVSGGKTGTAQVFSLRGGTYVAGRVKERLRDHALFIAFAPADAPKIALAVLVENGGFGAQSAAPIARQVLDYYIAGKVPQGEAGEDDSGSDVSN